MPGGKTAGPVRKSRVFLFFMLLNLAFLGILLLHAAASRSARGISVEENARMVRLLGLTDLCLFTEASYTRHPSVSDLATAFQDHPLSLEHFPSGSLVPPPRHLGRPLAGRTHGLD